MFLRIASLEEKKLIGKKVSMNVLDNKTFELWQSFMKNRKSISNVVGNNLYSIQVYSNLDYFKNFNPKNSFIKWAASEVSDHHNIPSNMEPFIIEKGKYAVFLHKGLASEFPKTANYIFSQWIPNSDYSLDDRPHFELLGPKYKNNCSDSEEEVWIPIKKK